MNFAVVDIETSGFSGVANTITEISILVFDGEKIIDEFTSLVNPQCPIPPKITQLTGISADMLVDAPLFAEIGEKVEEITRDCIFVAHSVNFDYPIIAKELGNMGIDFKRKKLCTVRYARAVFPGHRSYSLGNICRDFDIPINGRHRARGDAEATVKLLSLALEKDADKSLLNKQLNPRGRNATLPPNVDTAVFEALPQSPGIYRFLNEKKEVIYVGKAVNIQKRISGHFLSKTVKSKNMKLEIFDIQYELAGNELIALLMESAEIKKYYPKHNKALKKSAILLGIVCYENQKGVQQIGINRVIPNQTVYPIFTNQSDAHRFVLDFVEDHELCPQHCGIEKSKSDACQYFEKTCQGICCDQESVEDYNQRVQKALSSIAMPQEDLFIHLEGRTADEKSFVYIQNGAYAGYGFAPAEAEEAELLDCIQAQENNADTRSILHGYLIREIVKLQDLETSDI